MERQPRWVDFNGQKSSVKSNLSFQTFYSLLGLSHSTQEPALRQQNKICRWVQKSDKNLRNFLSSSTKVSANISWCFCVDFPLVFHIFMFWNLPACNSSYRICKHEHFLDLSAWSILQHPKSISTNSSRLYTNRTLCHTCAMEKLLKNYPSTHKFFFFLTKFEIYWISF